jgi:methylmalonyl-CoA mutase
MAAGPGKMQASGTRAVARDFPGAGAAEWRALAEKVVGAEGLSRLLRYTDDGIEIPPLHAPALGTAPADAAPAGGWPLAFELAQPHLHPDPAEAGRQVAEDLRGGADAAIVRLDRALGRGGDRPDGVLAYDRAALGRLLAGLDPAGAPIRLEPGERALETLADLDGLAPAAAAADGGAWRVLADPLGAALEGAPGDPGAAVQATLVALPDRPRLGLLADGRPWHEAGASEAQEIAAVLAAVVHWLREGERAGLTPEALLPRLELVLAVDDDLFPALAKLRAARLAMERILEAAGLEGPVRLRAETSRRMLARLDPWVNVLRTTVAALAAVAGGADAVAVHPLDRPLGEASALARRIARNVPLILREEAGAGRVRDPAAGSWHVAHLTRALAEAAWGRLQAIEAEGGLLAALLGGRPQAEVEATRRARLERIARRELELTGVSAFPTLDERPPPSEPFDPAPALAAARAALAAQERPLRAPPFASLRPQRLAEPFEALRARARAAAAASGAPPRLPLVGLGRPGELHDLLTWAESLLAVGGIEATRTILRSAGEAGRALAGGGQGLALACPGPSAAAAAEELVAALRAAGAERVWLLGPATAEGAAPLAPGLDVLAFLGGLHDLLGSPEPAPGGAA